MTRMLSLLVMFAVFAVVPMSLSAQDKKDDVKKVDEKKDDTKKVDEKKDDTKKDDTKKDDTTPKKADEAPKKAETKVVVARAPAVANASEPSEGLLPITKADWLNHVAENVAPIAQIFILAIIAIVLIGLRSDLSALKDQLDKAAHEPKPQA